MSLSKQASTNRWKCSENVRVDIKVFSAISPQSLALAPVSASNRCNILLLNPKKNILFKEKSYKITLHTINFVYLHRLYKWGEKNKTVIIKFNNLLD